MGVFGGEDNGDSDARVTEGILTSLGKAMQDRLRNVLPLVKKTPLSGADEICLPFISDEISIEARL